MRGPLSSAAARPQGRALACGAVLELAAPPLVTPRCARRGPGLRPGPSPGLTAGACYRLGSFRSAKERAGPSRARAYGPGPGGSAMRLTEKAAPSHAAARLRTLGPLSSAGPGREPGRAPPAERASGSCARLAAT